MQKTDSSHSKCSLKKQLMYILRTLVREIARKGTNTSSEKGHELVFTQSDSDFNACILFEQRILSQESSLSRVLHGPVQDVGPLKVLLESHAQAEGRRIIVVRKIDFLVYAFWHNLPSRRERDRTVVNLL